MSIVCKACNARKELSAFHKAGHGVFGHRTTCADCSNAHHRNKRENPKYLAMEYRTHVEWYYDRGGKAVMRKNTKLHRNRTGYPGYSDPTKHHARSLTRAAIRSGKIVRLPCERCGHSQAEAHHDDYGKPHEVRFLCNACHRKEHKTIRRAGEA